MIDAITSPGMAIDIRLSTQEPVQQLGARLAHILSGELSRMRADIAFASATGVAVHSAQGDAESLRAQQSSLLGHHQISLNTQTAMHLESALRSDSEQVTLEEAAHNEREDWLGTKDGSSDQQSESEDEPEGTSDDELDDAIQAAPDRKALGADQDVLVNTIRDALVQFQLATQESDISGSPIAVVLPADHWLEHDAPASLRISSQMPGQKSSDAVLILCLAFDGALAEEQTVWGFIYKNALCIGSAQGRWFQPLATGSDGSWLMTVTDSDALVSQLFCQRVDHGSGWEDHSGSDINNDPVKITERMPGIRIRIGDLQVECERWCWRIDEWAWY